MKIEFLHFEKSSSRFKETILLTKLFVRNTKHSVLGKNREKQPPTTCTIVISATYARKGIKIRGEVFVVDQTFGFFDNSV